MSTDLPVARSGTEDTAVDVILPGFSLSDPDTAEGLLPGLSITASSGKLSGGSSNGVSVIHAIDSNTITLRGTPATVQAFLQTPGLIEYSGEEDAFGIGAATLQVQVNSGSASNDLGTVRVDLSDVVDTRTGTMEGYPLGGDAGGDVIRGRAGDDTLLGGTGADSFVPGRGHGFEVVTDFQDDIDTIRIDKTRTQPDRQRRSRVQAAARAGCTATPRCFSGR